MKTVIGLGVLVLVGLAFWFWADMDAAAPAEMNEDTEMSENDANEARAVVTPGTYTVQPEASGVRFAGKKPLIEGYVNAGSIGVTDGIVSVSEDSATGTFTIDMTTLSVSETPTKPGQENALEGHLMGERWFNVAEYPTATFTITDIEPRADSETTFVYDVTGELTMKGQTHEISFPATIYQNASGMLHATADLEIDRTKWGITANSGTFFENLADNVIDDMVALSFSLIAEPS